MLKVYDAATRYEDAAAYLPSDIRRAAIMLTHEQKSRAEEFRLRSGRPVSIVFPEGERSLTRNGVLGDHDPFAVRSSDVATTVETATRSSMHTALESLRSGYITVSGGHRLGLCGTAVVKDGEVTNIKQISSISLRIAREVMGAADPLIPKLTPRGTFGNTLILSPPGGGKTTLLRDLVRQLSNGNKELSLEGFRISLADERGEIAAQYGGTPQLDVGRRTDVIDACPKALAAMLLLRAMNPQIIALDEITAPEDIAAITAAAHCGVGILATAHARDLEELHMRPLYKQLLGCGVFQYAVFISMVEGGRRYTVTELGET